MSRLIKDSSVQTVLEAANIVDVISGYTSLRKRGITYSGLCPFHQEKTPSFTVSADKGLYYCFGCGEGGDVVRFVERMENLSFTEVIEQLAERYDVQGGVRGGGRPRHRHARPGRAAAATARQGGHVLPAVPLGITERPGARASISRSAGLGREVCETFRVGLSPDEWRGLHAQGVQGGVHRSRDWRTPACWSARRARRTTASAAG